MATARITGVHAAVATTNKPNTSLARTLSNVSDSIVASGAASGAVSYTRVALNGRAGNVCTAMLCSSITPRTQMRRSDMRPCTRGTTA